MKLPRHDHADHEFLAGIDVGMHERYGAPPVPTLQFSSLDLPPGWEVHESDAGGQPFFYNAATGQVQWELPRGDARALGGSSEVLELNRRVMDTTSVLAE